VSATDNAAKTFVVLRLGKQRFALPSQIVEELAPSLRLHRFPHRSRSISGVIVRRGRIVAVLDIASLLGDKTSSAQHFYLVARCRVGETRELSAIPVDGECELATGELELPVDQPPHIAGTVRVANEALGVLNLDVLVASNITRSCEPSSMEAQP
jgi:chemotaxis signal transduction protein